MSSDGMEVDLEALATQLITFAKLAGMERQEFLALIAQGWDAIDVEKFEPPKLVE